MVFHEWIASHASPRFVAVMQHCAAFTHGLIVARIVNGIVAVKRGCATESLSDQSRHRRGQARGKLGDPRAVEVGSHIWNACGYQRVCVPQHDKPRNTETTQATLSRKKFPPGTFSLDLLPQQEYNTYRR